MPLLWKNGLIIILETLYTPSLFNSTLCFTMVILINWKLLWNIKSLSILTDLYMRTRSQTSQSKTEFYREGQRKTYTLIIIYCEKHLSSVLKLLSLWKNFWMNPYKQMFLFILIYFIIVLNRTQQQSDLYAELSKIESKVMANYFYDLMIIS